MRKLLAALLLFGVFSACGSRVERVTFHSGPVALAGSLLLPRGDGPFPAIVFVHGDGPETREGSRYLASLYAENGIAALIYDKRGTGESSGRFPARFDELAGDAVAAVQYLRGRADIDAGRIGMWGGSQGGWIAPLAASSPSARLRFLVVKAGPAVGPAELARWKSVSRVQRAGYSAGVVAQVNRLMDTQFQILRTGSGWAELEEQVRAARGQPWLPLVAVMRHSQWRSSWMTYGRDIDFDPASVLARLDVPMLWLFGDRDPETPLDASLEQLDVLRRSGKDITVEVYRGADHQIELPRVAKNRPNHAPGYLKTQIEWVVRQCTNRPN